MLKNYTKILVFIAFVFISNSVVALPPPPPPPTPIDGGVIGLIIAAIGFGIKKIRDTRK